MKRTSGNTNCLLEEVSLEDRIVQQSLLFLLEAVFLKTFTPKSYGIPSKYNVHMACKNIRKWKGVRWFVVSEMVNYYSTINHKILIHLISKKVYDQQVIDLIWKFLRAGVIINGKRFGKTTIGLCEDSVITPFLSNIYLHEVDVYAEKLKKELDTEKTSERNSEYMRAKSRLRSKVGLAKKKGYKQLRKMKSCIRVGLKLYYLRYKDN